MLRNKLILFKVINEDQELYFVQIVTTKKIGSLNFNLQCS